MNSEAQPPSEDNFQQDSICMSTATQQQQNDDYDDAPEIESGDETVALGEEIKKDAEDEVKEATTEEEKEEVKEATTEEEKEEVKEATNEEEKEEEDYPNEEDEQTRAANETSVLQTEENVDEEIPDRSATSTPLDQPTTKNGPPDIKKQRLEARKNKVFA
jgi:hypothetical protein